MSEQPLVSILIPTFNRADLLSETLNSVFAQTYTNWECIVVDDGSTDATAGLLASYIAKDSRFKYYKRPDTYLPGGNGARNYGFALSKGEFIQWFDDDDVMLPDFLNFKIASFNDTLEMVICSGSYVDENLSNPKNIDLRLQTFLYKDYVLWQFRVLTPSILFRKTFLEGKLLFTDKIIRGQETELFSRLFFKLTSVHYKILNVPLFLYRQHETTKSAENKIYVPAYKYSQSYINIQNLKRAIEIRDCQLINRCFQTLMVYFFMSLKHGDYSTTAFVYKQLGPLLKYENKFIFMEFKFICGFLLRFKRYSYRINKRWKTMELC
ncbi:glycosyltransferase family 2 protein [Lacinutrix himadriensis]|uniref:glycosyltransferase family 2 protein n=1 Tax=Lacinutrix himadriensis TaxID=641549 RepID=UPI0006E1D396|nr:glycosyltransferase family A protein [Lacinutrix himadriensis]